MPIHIIVLAAISGWAFDDFCGTPPRPWPGPGPGPWWLRKIIAAIGGGIAAFVFNRGINEVPDLLGTVAVGAVGGVFLASVASGLMGRLAAPDVQSRA
ncbi:MAG TPA: hypothetical protein VHM92_04570 [Allosphingosinicella sp.]|nr:hypothetical protein [Allosphingosinicella sp.]